MLEKHVEYNGIEAQIRIPDEPTGLVFIAPGAQISTNAPLIQAIANAHEDRGMATVIANLGGSELEMNDPFNVHKHFTAGLEAVIDGYMKDNAYKPDQFELTGHSMGGAAVMSVAKNHPVSSITALDPTPVHTDVLTNIDSPTTIIISDVRSFKNSGRRMFSELEPTGMAHELHEIATSKDRNSGHMFEGQEHAVADVIRNQTPPSHDLDTPSPKDDSDSALEL